MRCPECDCRTLMVMSEQTSHCTSSIDCDVEGEDYQILDGKLLLEGDLWIDPDAHCWCDFCAHEGSARDFAQDHDFLLIKAALDHYLHLELADCLGSGETIRSHEAEKLLRSRGRDDLANHALSEAKKLISECETNPTMTPSEGPLHEAKIPSRVSDQT